MRIRSLLCPALLILLALAAPARATTFTVNVTDDTSDGTCNGAHCSLREALAAAQSGVGAPHTIAFDIPGPGVKRIDCLAANGAWPVLTQSVTIDGFTQPGSTANTIASGAINAVPLIELHGVGVGAGLQILDQVPNPVVVVRGLVINGFSDFQVALLRGTLVVRGSFIGTSADGLAGGGAPNAEAVLVNSGSLTVGGLSPADRNVLSGSRVGVSAILSPNAGIDVLLQGNLIGLNKNGTAAIPNQAGYTSGGCNGGNATGRIGGPTPAERNVISGNTLHGVSIGNCGVGTSNTSTGSFVRGNLIGTDVTGTLAIPNGRGVEVTSGPNIVVGGLAAGEGNLIAFNSGAGVVLSGSVAGLGVLGNSIHSNGGLGIDIDANDVTANDADDADVNRPNFPVVTAITRGATTTTVEGTFEAPTTGTYRLQLFTNVLPDALSHGEGQTLLGQITPAAGVTGAQAFSITVDTVVPAAEFLALTLTDPAGNTSEFSQFLADLSITGSDAPDPAGIGQPVTYTFTVTNTSTLFPSGPVRVAFDFTNTSTFVSATGGAVPVAGVVTVTLGTIVPGGAAVGTVVLSHPTVGTFGNTLVASSNVTDPVPANNSIGISTAVVEAVSAFTISGQVRDLNDTGVPGVTLTLSGSQAATLATDADGRYAFTALPAGGTYTVTPSAATFSFSPPAQTFANLQADQVASFFVAQIGTFRRFFAEGATGSFFDTSIALLNATGQPATATVRFQKENGQVISQTVQMAGLARATVDPETLPGLEGASFSTVVESTQPIIADRTMRWDASGYGSHAETSIAQPLTTWYLAEGATTGGFNLFYLLQNPTGQTATVSIQYLRPTPAAPITRTYTVGPNTRRSIYVNGEDPALDEAEISAVITSTNAVPIVVERAMYLDSNGQFLGAGHESAAVADLSTSWFFAEGATGPFFNMFILVANPGDADAAFEARYLLPGGQVITRTYLARARSRLTIGVHEQDPALAQAVVSTTLQSTNAVPFLAERAMWWPSLALVPQWQEGHNSAGAVRTGEKWGLADGEEGGPSNQQTFVLVANTSGTAGSVQVTVVFEDGTTAQLEAPLVLAPNSRTTLPMRQFFPASAGRRFGTIVESLGPSPAQIVVERAMYSDAPLNGQSVTWAAGTNVVGTRLR